MMLGKSKKTIPNAAMAAESSGCANKEGFLKKKNSKGEWKDRFCYFSNNFFLTYKPKGNGPSTELKESIDLKLLSSLLIQMDVLQIELSNGDRMEFKGDPLELASWVKIMKARSNWANGITVNKRQSVDMNSLPAMPGFPPLEGFLYKKNSKGEWKKRFCSCKQHAFVGYKENSSHEIKENIDYKDIVGVKVGVNEKGKPTIEIDVSDGEKVIFQVDNAEAWVEGLELRSQWYGQFVANSSPRQSLSQSPDRPGGSLEGMLKKKNSAGVWKDRYAIFEKNFFKTFRPKNGKATAEVKENVDLKDIESVMELSAGTMKLELKQGTTMLFQGQNIAEWVAAIQSRAQIVIEEYNSRLDEMLSKTVHLEGWLLKKSHNKYQGLQERFVRVEGLLLKYYKEKDGKYDRALGSINLSKAEFVRALSEDSDCLLFEVHDEGDKTYKFQASSHKEMLHWVSTIDRLINAHKAQVQAAIELKLAEETPIRIKWFDEQGESYLVGEIRADFESMYPERTEDGDSLSIKLHLDYANEVVGYLTDFVPEIQRCEGRPARFDVLALMLTEVNTFLSDRLLTFLPVTDNERTRSALIENANLGDLHAILDWITRYQSTLKGIRCPVANAKDNTPAATAATILSTKYLTPKQCALFDAIPPICRLYAYGGSIGAKGGASVHLYEHCVKVWTNCISAPEEMLQRRNDGTFFTHTPIDMWEAINMHISLATSTRTPVLHVMMADKVVAALNEVFDMIIRFINTADASLYAGLKDVELEFFCALANDTALHIEEVVNLIDQFDIEEIRTRIDDIFEPLTTNLVNCGQACLKRLSRMVMQDVQSLLDDVFQEEWMEGNQMHVVTATIVDYMNDFEEFLVQFWANKFLDTILEEMVVSYTRSLLFRKSYGTTSTTSTTSSAASTGSDGRFMSSLFQKTKQITQTITQTVYTPSHVRVDGESLGRLAQDVNILNSFFSTKTDQERASDYLAILNEVSILLFVDLNGLLQHMQKCLEEIPSALPAVKEVMLASMKMRADDFTKSEVDRFLQVVQPMLSEASVGAAEKAKLGEAEGTLGILYMEVVPANLLQNAKTASLSLAQKKKLMSNVELGRVHARKSDDNGDDNDEDVGMGRASTGNLVDDVMGVLQQMDDEDDVFIQEREDKEREKEMQKNKIGVLKYDGDLEKRSPANHLWQKRFFRLMTRETFDDDHPYAYSFMWYKKEGGTVLKSLDAAHIQSLAVLQSPRPLVFVPSQRHALMLKVDAGGDPSAVSVQPLEQCDSSANLAGVETYIFTVIQDDGKEHVLKSAKVDRMLKWINLLSLASGLGYDPKTRHWSHDMVEIYEQQAKERAKLQSFQTVSATPLAPFGGARARSASSGSSLAVPVSVQHDSESAAAMIASMKSEESERNAEENALLEKERLERESAAAVEEKRLTELAVQRERLAEKKSQEEIEERLQAERQKQEDAKRMPVESESPKVKADDSLNQVNPLIRARAASASSSTDNPLRRPPPPPGAIAASPAVPTGARKASESGDADDVTDSANLTTVQSTVAGPSKINLLKKRVMKSRVGAASASAGSAVVGSEDSSAAAKPAEHLTTEAVKTEAHAHSTPLVVSTNSPVLANNTISQPSVAVPGRSSPVVLATKAVAMASTSPPPPAKPVLASASPQFAKVGKSLSSTMGGSITLDATKGIEGCALPAADYNRETSKDLVQRVVANVNKETGAAVTVGAASAENSPIDASRALVTAESTVDDNVVVVAAAAAAAAADNDDDSSAGASSDDDGDRVDADSDVEDKPHSLVEDPAVTALKARLADIFPEHELDSPLRKQISLAHDCLSVLQDSGGMEVVVDEFISHRLQESLSSVSSNASEVLDEASWSDVLMATGFVASYVAAMGVFSRQRSVSAASEGSNSNRFASEVFSLSSVLNALVRIVLVGGTTGALGGIEGSLRDSGLRMWTIASQSPMTLSTRCDAMTHCQVATIGISLWEVCDRLEREISGLAWTTADLTTQLKHQLTSMCLNQSIQLIDAITTFVSNADLTTKFPSQVESRYALHCVVINDVELLKVDFQSWITTHSQCADDENVRLAFSRLQSLTSLCGRKVASLIVQEISPSLEHVFMPLWLSDQWDDDDNDSEGEGSNAEPRTLHPTAKAMSLAAQRLQFMQEHLAGSAQTSVIRSALEEVLVVYIRSLLFKKNVSNPPPVSQKTGFFSGMYQKAKQALLPPHVHVDSNSLARLAQDTKLVNELLTEYGGSEFAGNLLPALSDVSFMLVVDLDGLAKHIAQSSSTNRAVATALQEMALSILRMRTNDFTKADIDKFTAALSPIMQAASDSSSPSNSGAIFVRVTKH